MPIKFSVRGRDLGGTVAEAQERIAKNCQVACRLPHGLGRRVRGSAKGQGAPASRGADQLSLLILILLYGLFNSMRDSLLAVAGIPFAVAGGIIALYISGLDFSVSAAIGFISLLGVAVMDGILNITYFRGIADCAACRSPRRCFTAPNSACGRC